MGELSEDYENLSPRTSKSWLKLFARKRLKFVLKLTEKRGERKMLKKKVGSELEKLFTIIMVLMMVFGLTPVVLASDNVPTVSTPKISVTEVSLNTTGSAINVTGVSLNTTSSAINVGATRTLTATIVPTNATNKNVTWKSSNKAVAIVDANGKIFGVGTGTAIITVTTADGKLAATCTVTVSTPKISVTGVSLNTTSSAINVGATRTLTAIIAPTNATNKNVTWKSSNKAVAIVDVYGKIFGVSAGTAVITVTTADGKLTATCTVTVSRPKIPVTGGKLKYN